MKTNPNDAAYPLTFDNETLEGLADAYKSNDKNLEVGGLTKREYFAAMAMQGLSVDWTRENEKIAVHAVLIADALIAELNKEGGQDEIR